MINKQLLNSTSQAYVIAKYLKDLHSKIGTENYLASPVRTHHCTGNTWFGVNSLGDTDCLARQFRLITDSLEQSYKHWDKIAFVSESCININTRSKLIHRVEHTREVIGFVKTFEQEFIIGNKPFTAQTIAEYLITNQVVCLIKQSEQLTQYHVSDDKPFSKYSTRIFYQGTDISDYTLDQVIAINKTRYADLLTEISHYDFSAINERNSKKLIGIVGKHTMPSMTIAIKHHNNQFMLLKSHYHHKLNKRTDPNNRKWYNADDAAMYHKWDNAQAA